MNDFINLNYFMEIKVRIFAFMIVISACVLSLAVHTAKAQTTRCITCVTASYNTFSCSGSDTDPSALYCTDSAGSDCCGNMNKPVPIETEG